VTPATERSGRRRQDRRRLRTVKILVAVKPPALHHAIVSLLRTRPDFEIAGSQGGFRNLRQRLRRLLPALVVVNVSPFEADLCWAVATLKRSSPGSKVILLSAVEDFAYQAKRCGADAYLHEDRLIDRLPRMAGALAGRPASTASNSVRQIASSCSMPTKKQTRGIR
jgi:DNA-binding NarL/FixJ family response regulator